MLTKEASEPHVMRRQLKLASGTLRTRRARRNSLPVFKQLFLWLLFTLGVNENSNYERCYA